MGALKSKEFIGGAFWLFVAIVVICQALELKMGNYQTPGPGFIPLGVGLGMAVLSLIIMGRAVRVASAPGAAIKVSPGACKKIGLVFGSLLVYALLFNFLGFPLTTFVLLFLLFKGGNPEGWLKQGLLAAGATVFTYFLFSVLLSCELPRGILGF
jgi:putative tricarboxylic transport membrane protein